jgi:N,N'-diacetylchitobiose transport system permease protein
VSGGGWLAHGLTLPSLAAIVLVLGVPLYLMGYNYARTAGGEAFWSTLATCLVVLAFVVAIALPLAFLVAVAIAKLRFHGTGTLVGAVVAIQLLPGAGILIPNYLSPVATYDSSPLLHHLAGVALVYLVFVLPFTVWLLRGFLLTIPRDLEEAAMLDGATQFGAFMRVLLPLIAPGLVAAAIFAFIGAWNEWLFATTILGGAGKETLMMTLYRLGGGDQGVPYGTVMAMATLAALPIVVLFVAVQRHVGFGLTADGARG